MENKKEDRVNIRIYFTIILKFLSWIMATISIFVLIMEVLSAYRFYVTDIFSRPKILVAALFITFGIWFLRSLLESYVFPTSRIYMVLFLILTIMSGYILTTRIF